jgi:mannosyltransferase OCH1-like enzyme
MQVSQIFLTDHGGNEVPPALSQLNEVIKAGFPAANYQRFNNESLRAFIEENFDKEVVRAYDSLRSYSNKADLGRYCLLYATGGWYFDMGIRLNTPVELGERIEMLAFREIQKFTGTCWACMTAVLFSKPGNPALMYAIEQIVKKCQQSILWHHTIVPHCHSRAGASLGKTR